MPSKTCPSCGSTWGVRKLVCDCGYDFGCKRPRKAAHHPTFPYPEPGEWVWEARNGFPRIEPPGPLPEGLLDIEEVQHQIRHEGLGFCLNFLDSKRIGDPELRALWGVARVASRDVLSYLEKQENGGDDGSD